MTEQPTSFADLLASAERSAVHLEMRDVYTPDDPSFIALQGGPAFDRTERQERWHGLVGAAVRRGVQVRRARIVSEPVTEFICYEHAVTQSMNIDAGEVVRWLPRRRASDLALPGNDFWVFDDRLVRFGHFAGDGRYLDDELCDDSDVIKLCLAAFDAVWERAVDHAEYRLA